MTARVLDAARGLKGIVKYGVGIDAIDMAAAMRRGIPVVNVPQYAEEAVGSRRTRARCFEICDGRPVTIRSRDPRLRVRTMDAAFG